MKKPGTLRAAIAAAVPDLNTDPDKFLVFVDQGSVAAANTQAVNFEYRYTLNVMLLDFAGDPDIVFFSLLTWARANQPSLLENRKQLDNGIQFEVDLINHESCDVSIKLPLTEQVIVAHQADGTVTMTYPDEPKREYLATNLAGDAWKI